jgi:ADP-ribose pyrophosphatase YjhB (NUDIX family)
MTSHSTIEVGEELSIVVDGQTCLLSWHPPHRIPEGKPHGAEAVCVTASGEVVIVSDNGIDWGLPGGRPEGNETLEETMRREVGEEACATVLRARLLGFGRGHCIEGPEAGLVLVRSFWRADVVLNSWEPSFEKTHRRAISAVECLDCLPQVFAPLFGRVLAEAEV